MWSNKFYKVLIGADLALAQRIYSLLPSDVVVSNLIGQSMSESPEPDLHGIDAYFAHVGTLQHKVSFFRQSERRRARCKSAKSPTFWTRATFKLTPDLLHRF